jgi:predicted MFS family arabinose efflux permease
MPRRRGAASGLLILIVGAWAAVIPFIGHYLDFVVGPDDAWDMTSGRFWLSLVPGVVAVVGGLMLLRSGNRATATLGAQLALAAGIWLVIGRELSHLWTTSWSEPPLGGTDKQALELLLYFYGVGALITALAGTALGRVTARHVGDAERLAPAATTDDAGRTGGGRFRRDGQRDHDVVTEEEPTRAPSAR